MTPNEYLKADALDILFENRNKAYGAYALRKSYDRRVILATGGALAFGLAFVLFGILKERYFGGRENNGLRNNSVTITHVEIEKEEVKKPEPVKEKPKPRAQVAFTDRIKLVKEPKNPLPPQDTLDRVDPGPQNTPGPTDTRVKPPGEPPPADGGGKKPPEPQPEPEPEPAILNHAQVMPEFPGGLPALSRFLQRYLRHPHDGEEVESQTVLVRFVVDKEGVVSAAEIAKTAGTEYDNEVLRVVRKMPAWKAGENGGKKVAVYFTLPVTFTSAEQ